MKKCSLCSNSTVGDELAFLFIGQEGDEKEICPICKKNMDILQESENPDRIKEAINYLHACSLSSDDEEVVAFIEDIINANGSVANELESERIKSESEHSHAGSFWITGMKVFAWIAFFGISIAGLFFATQVGNQNTGMGVLIFLASLIVAFLSIAILMIFLNMARDLSEIKNFLQNRRK